MNAGADRMARQRQRHGAAAQSPPPPTLPPVPCAWGFGCRQRKSRVTFECRQHVAIREDERRTDELARPLVGPSTPCVSRNVRSWPAAARRGRDTSRENSRRFHGPAYGAQRTLQLTGYRAAPTHCQFDSRTAEVRHWEITIELDVARVEADRHRQCFTNHSPPGSRSAPAPKNRSSGASIDGSVGRPT